MPPTRRPGRPLLSASAGDAVFSGGRTGASGFDREPFRTVFEITGETTFKGEPAYLGREVWVFVDGGTVAVENGHALTAALPGVVLGGGALGDGDLALGRIAPGGGTECWELLPLGGANAGDNACGGCGWLGDVPAPPTEEEFAAGVRTPDMLLTLRGGSGRCGCIPTEDGPTDGSRLALTASNVWTGYTEVALCCGCAYPVFTITGALTATLALTAFTTCDDAEECPPSTSISLTQECCGTDAEWRPFVQYVGKGADPCSGDRSSCDNTFRVRVTCVPAEECSVGSNPCGGCIEGDGPAAWRITTTGFSNCCAPYNGRWRLESAGDGTCEWAAACAETGVTVTQEITCALVTVTFAGADCGTVVYEYEPPGDTGIRCFAGGQTMTRVSGSTDSPATVTAFNVSCVEDCPDVELLVSSSGGLPCSACEGTPSTVWGDTSMGTPGPGGWEASVGGGGVTTECECDDVLGGGSCKGFGVRVTCNSDDTFTVWPYCNRGADCAGDTAVCYAGPSGPITAENQATPPAILFTVEFEVDDPLCEEGPTTVTLTFNTAP
jgi:hypothetical protein